MTREDKNHFMQSSPLLHTSSVFVLKYYIWCQVLYDTLLLLFKRNTYSWNQMEANLLFIWKKKKEKNASEMN